MDISGSVPLALLAPLASLVRLRPNAFGLLPAGLASPAVYASPSSFSMILFIPMQHLISIKDLRTDEIEEIFAVAKQLKSNPHQKILKDKTLAMIFEKPSNRTRVSFEVGMFQLGGHAVSLSESMIQMGSREAIKDVSRTLSRYVNGIVFRTFEHSRVEEMAQFASVPVINAFSDYSHPCQALADIFTIMEKRKKIKGLKLVFVGDGNNVARSLNFLCQKTGIDFILSCPTGYELPDCKVITDPKEAVKNADVIYTDVWASMGQESEKSKKEKDFQPYQVNNELLQSAWTHHGASGHDTPLIMHCLPAHRGEEITEEVIESENSIVFDQAENRLHVQKAVLVKLLG